MRVPSLFLAAALALAAPAAVAQELKIGLQVETTAIDPHFADLSANSMVALHIFSPLVRRDEKLRLQPGLAESWKLIDDNTWEFKLRRGVKFHDGGEFTAEDVKTSIERVAAVPNSPSPLTVYVRPIKAIEIVDPYTVRFKTDGLFAAIPLYMSTISMMSKKALDAVATPENRNTPLLATSQQLNAGQGAIGTGPFRFVEWKRGEQIVLDRFDGYFGEKPHWQRVVIRPLSNNAARTSALLSGAVDLIDYVPLDTVAKLAADPKLSVQDSITTRIIFLAMDRHRDAPPFITDKAGNPLGRNPFNDLRVRKAISMAINRRAIVERTMEGKAAATGQIMPEGFPGYSPTLAVEGFDPDGARKLLAEAGYPDGFGLTLHSPQNRYPNDAQVAQAVGQMLARIGLAVKVEAVPPAVFFPQAAQLAYSFLLTGYGIVTGEPSSFMSFSLLTTDAARGRGVGNRGRYSNPKLDALFDRSLTLIGPPAEAVLREATEEAVTDVGFVPLFHNLTSWAMRNNLTYAVRTDEYTLAQYVRPR